MNDRARHLTRVALKVGAALALPTALYYLLRLVGFSVYLALVSSTLVSATPGLYALVRHRRVDGLSTYFTAMMLGGLVVVMVPGSTRFLLARDALLTAVTGVWFLASTRSTRPLVYLFTKPLLEGRFRWPGDWELLWPLSSRFRRMWRISSSIWGVGLLADAVLRVVFTYTLRPDLVPAWGLGLYVATIVVINIVVNVYFTLCRIHDPRSPIRRGDAAEPARDRREDARHLSE